MCSRYRLLAPPEDILARFGLSLTAHEVLTRIAANDIRPTDLALTVAQDNTPAILPWGLKVSWQPAPVINARSETAPDKPTFAPLLNRRVLVPASGYYEWRKTDRAKIKTHIGLADQPLFAMAGFQSEDRFVILTCAPDSAVAHIHNRMPVILNPDSEEEWLNPDLDFRQLAALLKPYKGPFEISEQEPKPPAQHSLFD
ncbi:MAG: SOS response-associated peptidase [Rhodospirillaceae bacterium]